MSTQWKLRLACAFAQLWSISLPFPRKDILGSWPPTECKVKTLIRLHGHTGGSDSCWVNIWFRMFCSAPFYDNFLYNHIRPVKWEQRAVSQRSLYTTKPTNCPVHPAKPQISLGIRLVWSESWLSAWRNFGSLATHRTCSEDWSDWVDAKADPSLHWAHRSLCWFCHAAT